MVVEVSVVRVQPQQDDDLGPKNPYFAISFQQSPNQTVVAALKRAFPGCDPMMMSPKKITLYRGLYSHETDPGDRARTNKLMPWRLLTAADVHYVLTGHQLRIVTVVTDPQDAGTCRVRTNFEITPVKIEVLNDALGVYVIGTNSLLPMEYAYILCAPLGNKLPSPRDIAIMLGAVLAPDDTAQT